MNNFIEEYIVADSEECEFVIDWFENHKDKHISGVYGPGGNVDTTVKDSTDIVMNIFESNEVNSIILSAISKGVAEYKKKYYMLNDIDEWSVASTYNIQRYNPGQGYSATHCEQSGIVDYNSMLVWTLYLNDVTDEGGTFFPYQRQLVSAKTGKLVLFPSPWTHMHRGVISSTQTKYIATGWFDYCDSK